MFRERKREERGKLHVTASLVVLLEQKRVKGRTDTGVMDGLKQEPRQTTSDRKDPPFNYYIFFQAAIF